MAETDEPSARTTKRTVVPMGRVPGTSRSRPNPMTEQDCARSEGLLAQMLALHPTEIDLSLDRMHRLFASHGGTP